MSWFPRRLLNAFHAMFHLQGQRLPSLSRAAAAASSRRIAEKKSWLSSTSVSHNSAQAHLRLTGAFPLRVPAIRACITHSAVGL